MRSTWKWLMALALLTVMGCRMLQSTGFPSPEATVMQEPAGNEANLSRGEVFITSQELQVKESYPLQVSLLITGSLPTPCHQLKVEVSEPDADNQIAVEAYSLVDPNQNCIQVLKGFEENIPLGSYPDGSYTVVLNGEEVGQFTQ
jgi:hypothetical protein